MTMPKPDALGPHFPRAAPSVWVVACTYYHLQQMAYTRMHTVHQHDLFCDCDNIASNLSHNA